MGINASRVYSGAQSFDEFARETSKDWERLAAYLMKRWRVPAGVGREDVKQELLLHAWRYIPRWNPERGMPLERYVLFSAISRTKRWMHQQRRARGCRDESRHELTFAELGIKGDWRSVEAGQEAVVERELELSRLVVECGSLRERILVTAFWHKGNAAAAAAAVYAEPELRLACRFDSRRDAVRHAKRAAETVTSWRRARVAETE